MARTRPSPNGLMCRGQAARTSPSSPRAVATAGLAHHLPVGDAGQSTCSRHHSTIASTNLRAATNTSSTSLDRDPAHLPAQACRRPTSGLASTGCSRAASCASRSSGGPSACCAVQAWWTILRAQHLEHHHPGAHHLPADEFYAPTRADGGPDLLGTQGTFLSCSRPAGDRRLPGRRHPTALSAGDASPLRAGA